MELSGAGMDFTENIMKRITQLGSDSAVRSARSRPTLRQIVCISLGLLLVCEAHATFHTWKISEIYSSADGSVQFIELHESLGFNGENLLATHFIQCVSGTLTNTFVFPTNLPSNTANKTFLIGTANLTIVPGGVIPN